MGQSAKGIELRAEAKIDFRFLNAARPGATFSELTADLVIYHQGSTCINFG